MTDDDALDRNLEEVVRADAETVERLVASALAAAPARRVTAGRLAAAGAALAVVVGGVFLTWPAAPDRQGVIRMRNVGEIILVDYPDGSRAVIGPAKADSTLFAGFDYVMFEGEPQ